MSNTPSIIFLSWSIENRILVTYTKKDSEKTIRYEKLGMADYK